MSNVKNCRYYLSYRMFKGSYSYCLKDRLTNEIIFHSISFFSVYNFIKKYRRLGINFDNICIESMTLSKFFRDYVTFNQESGGTRI